MISPFLEGYTCFPQEENRLDTVIIWQVFGLLGEVQKFY